MHASQHAHAVLYDTAALQAVLDRMARDLAARLHGQERITLVGIRRRGAPLAEHLHVRLREQLPQAHIERLDLAIKRYADDLTLLHPQTELTEQSEHARIDLSGRATVVVDDVLYFGFSLMRAVQYLQSKGANTLHTVVLVDRRCATLPIHADVAGLVLQVAPGQVVECHVPPFEPTLQIELVAATMPPLPVDASPTGPGPRPKASSSTRIPS